MTAKRLVADLVNLTKTAFKYVFFHYLRINYYGHSSFFFSSQSISSQISIPLIKNLICLHYWLVG